MMHRLRGFLAPTVAIALVTAASVARAQHIVGVRDARAWRTDSVFQRFDRTDSPGCALGVYQDGKILYTPSAHPGESVRSNRWKTLSAQIGRAHV